MLLKSLVFLTGMLAVAAATEQAAESQDVVAQNSVRSSDGARRQQADEDAKLELFAMQHVNAKDAVRVAYEVLGLSETRLTADERSNTVIFSGSTEEMEKVRSLLKQMDASPGGEDSIKVLPLQSADSREVVALLQQVVHNRGLRLAADVNTNSVIASGSADALAIVEALLTHLDSEGQAKDNAAPTDFTVFYLKHTTANDALSLVQQVAAGMPLNLVADEQRNALLARGTQQQIDFITELLKYVDVANGDDSPLVLKTYKLENTNANEVLAVAQTVMAERRSVRLAADGSTNALVLYGREDDNQQLAALLEELDVARTSEPNARQQSAVKLPKSYKVRVIVLSNEQGGQVTNLPSELTPVVEELETYGFNSLSVFSQMMVNTSGRVNATGRNGNIEIRGEGHVSQMDEDRVRLVLDVEMSQADESITVATAATEIYTQVGHYTVLGVSPSDKNTVIFVVQVLAE